MKKIILIALTLFIASVNAQQFEEKKINLIVSNMPQYIFVNGFRFDFEKSIRNGQQSLVFAPHFYLKRMAPRTEDFFRPEWRTYNDMRGYAIDGAHKFFLKKNANSQGPYFGYGFTAQRFEINYNEFSWVVIEDDGIEYQEYKEVPSTDKINKFGVNQMFGFQARFKEHFVTDIFGGFGVRYSDVKSNNAGARNFGEFHWSYGYSGIVFNFGFKFGVLL